MKEGREPLPEDLVAADVPAAIALRFHHVGIATRGLEQALQTYRDLFGFRVLAPPIEVPHAGVRACFVEAAPGILLELLEGLGADSPVDRVLERSGPGPYHLCYEVADLEEAVRALRARGCLLFRRFDSPTPAYRRFAFLFTPEHELFELCEPATS